MCNQTVGERSRVQDWNEKIIYYKNSLSIVMVLFYSWKRLTSLVSVDNVVWTEEIQYEYYKCKYLPALIICFIKIQEKRTLK